MKEAPLEILHLAKYYYPAHGGIETATRDLAEAGVRLGCRVRCQSAAKGKSASEFVHNSVEVKAYPERWNLLSAPISYSLLLQKIDGKALVHAHLPNPMVELRLLAKLLLNPGFARRLVPFVHAYPVGQGRLGKIWFRFVTRPILKRVKAALVSNPYLLQAFPAFAEWREKFHVMPFAADPISWEHWQSLVEKRVESRRVVALGRMVPYKGYDVLLRAWKILCDQRALNGFELDLVGTGPQEAALREFVSKNGLEGSVHFRGSLDDAAKWQLLERAGLMVAPSTTRAETFGISILEAMAHGLPVVTTTLDTGVAALARGGECGAVAAPGDHEALAKALRGLLSKPAGALDIAGRNNLAFVQENFSRQSLKRHYRAFLREHFNKS